MFFQAISEKSFPTVFSVNFLLILGTDLTAAIVAVALTHVTATEPNLPQMIQCHMLSSEDGDGATLSQRGSLR